jgi:hypothetical protein
MLKFEVKVKEKKDLVGFYGNARRYPNDPPFLIEPRFFSEKWMDLIRTVEVSGTNNELDIVKIKKYSPESLPAEVVEESSEDQPKRGRPVKPQE